MMGLLLRYRDMVLLKSIESPREILCPEQLRRLGSLAQQGFVSTGTTTAQNREPGPTARLTRSGQAFLDQALLDVSLWDRLFGQFRKDVRACRSGDTINPALEAEKGETNA